MTCSRVIYLQNSGVLARFDKQIPTKILEVGFGTSLNFVLTADAAIEANCPIFYTALEQHLLDVETLRGLGHEAYLRHPNFNEQLFSYLQAPDVGTSETDLGNGIAFRLRLGDATEMSFPKESFDAVYLDPFSPENNPDLWNRGFIERLYHTMRPGARLTTYSVKGTLRRMLKEIGFTVEKRRGVPGKREVLVAIRGG